MLKKIAFLLLFILPLQIISSSANQFSLTNKDLSRGAAVAAFATIGVFATIYYSYCKGVEAAEEIDDATFRRPRLRTVTACTLYGICPAISTISIINNPSTLSIVATPCIIGLCTGFWMHYLGVKIPSYKRLSNYNNFLKKETFKLYRLISLKGQTIESQNNEILQLKKDNLALAKDNSALASKLGILVNLPSGHPD